jgi:hypothetical protein
MALHQLTTIVTAVTSSSANAANPCEAPPDVAAPTSAAAVSIHLVCVLSIQYICGTGRQAKCNTECSSCARHQCNDTDAVLECNALATYSCKYSYTSSDFMQSGFLLLCIVYVQLFSMFTLVYYLAQLLLDARMAALQQRTS